MTSDWLHCATSDGRTRCWWPGDHDDYRQYHDTEWGRPVTSDARLFEKLALEGFQSGLSWLTILRKRENFRSAFADFDVATVARFGDGDVARLLGDAGIVRHRGKIAATINNAQRCCDLIDEAGSLAHHIWQYEPAAPEGDPLNGSGIPGFTPTSTRLSKDLKQRGWKFVGPTTMYAFMQAMGLVNDHIDGCEWREQCRIDRENTVIP